MQRRRFVPAFRACVRMLLLFSFVIVPVGLVSVPAAAQGTDGALSDPISSRDLTRYADRLGLSAQQRLALESVHDQYKIQFRALREGDIARFMEEGKELGGGMMPQREQVEEMFDKLEQLQTRIRALDERFFTQVQPLLTEAQAAMLPRVRLMRERDRCLTQQMMLMAIGRQFVDVSDIFFSLDLSPDVFAAADPSIALYERRLTAHLRKLSEAGRRMFLDMFDAFDERGFGQYSKEDLQDPEVMQKLGEAMQEIWADITANFQKIIGEVADLNRQTVKSTAVLLPPRDARIFRTRFYSKAYPRLAGVLSHDADHWFTAALELDGLTPEEADAIADAQLNYRQQIDRVVEEAVALADEQQQNINPMNPDFQQMRQFSAKLGELGKKAADITNAATAALEEIIGADRMARVRGGRPEAGDETAIAPPVDVQIVDAGQRDDEREPPSWSRSRFLPPPISRGDLARYADMLALDDDHKAVLRGLHLDYLDRFEQLPVFERLEQARSANHERYRGESFDAAAAEQALDELYQLRREAFDAVRGLDEAFFDDVGVALLEEGRSDALDRVRRVRLRRAYAVAAADVYFGGDARAEATLDLVAIVRGGDLPADGLAPADPILLDYETSSIDLVKGRFDAQFDLSKAQELFGLRMYRAQREGDDSVSQMQTYGEFLNEPSRRLDRANDALAQLNRATLEKLLDALSAPSARSVRLAYLRAAHPRVYDDPICVDEQLNAAMDLDDLTGEQRSRLTELAATYRPEYERLSQEMVEVSRSVHIDPLSSETKDWEAWQEKQHRMQQLNFERNEINFRAINRLKAMLREDQLQRLGGLPEPPEEEEYEIYW